MIWIRLLMWLALAGVVLCLIASMMAQFEFHDGRTAALFGLAACAEGITYTVLDHFREKLERLIA